MLFKCLLSSSFLTLLKIISSIIFITTFPHLIQSQDQTNYYDLCEPYTCGNLTFTFPFSSSLIFGSTPLYCGLPRYQITCDPISSQPSLDLSGRNYRVKYFFPADDESLITLVDTQLIQDLNSSSCKSLRNLSFTTNDWAPLTLPTWAVNISFIECPTGHVLPPEFNYSFAASFTCEEGVVVYLYNKVLRFGQSLNVPTGCGFVTVPVTGFLNGSNYLTGNGSLNGSSIRGSVLFDVLNDGFSLEWPFFIDCATCQKTGGRCGYDGSLRKIVCFCNGGCKTVKHHINWKLIVGVAVGGSSLLIVVVVLFIFKYKKGTLPSVKTLHLKKNPTTENAEEEFKKNYRSILVRDYTYNEIKKMTNGFKEKLGQGGYGSVYKGYLSNGHPIAVKLLENAYEIGHDFYNEVSTIGRIHHDKVIRLVGFCWNGSKQALIYEYMPNGSLADLLAKEEASLSLGFPKLLEIAIGVAHGIEYLHTGCEWRILHLDIKPQNVLLDQNFKPKVSDFGLAKIYSKNKSLLTMKSGARGTIGYIAPEIFLRNIGNPSHKSDVYSYGMLVLEMIGEKNKHAQAKTSTSSGAYFPGWIYDKLIEEQEDMEMVIDCVVEEEVSIRRKMAMVGLWCIQINPKDRPPMTKVVEMLTGNVEAIEMPPQPFFFSPPRVPFDEHDEINSVGSDTSTLPLTFVSVENQ